MQGPEWGSTCAHGWWDSDTHLPRTPPSCPARPVIWEARNTPAHTCSRARTCCSQGPHGARGWGVGGLSAQSPGCCQNPSESCPPPPQAPISGCGGHNSRCGYPPQLTHIGPPPFPQPQPEAGAGGPLPLPPSWPPSRWCSASPAPFCGGGGAYVWVGSFPLSMGACSRSGWGWVAQEEIRLES